MAIDRIRTPVDRELVEYYNKVKIQDNTINDHNDVIDGLKCLLSEELIECPELTRHGEIGSGFASDDCDLDISVKYSDDMDKWSLIPAPRTVLHLDPYLDEPCNIFDKVVHRNRDPPVIEFIYCPEEREYKVFLSLDNKIGVSRAKLLETYTKIDPIVPIIGTLVKEWARKAGLCGHKMASTLSWILMVIHYLQQKDVLPNLQNIGPNIEPQIVDGVDTYFFADADCVGRYFECINHGSLTDLLIGFFAYYAMYDFDNEVSVHLDKDAEKGIVFESNIRIFDPFFRAKNLTAQLSKQNSDKIISEIVAGYEDFTKAMNDKRRAPSDVISILSRQLRHRHVAITDDLWRTRMRENAQPPRACLDAEYMYEYMRRIDSMAERAKSLNDE